MIRHFEITDPADLAGLRHTVWAVAVPDDLDMAIPSIDRRTMTGGLDTYEACQREAARLRAGAADAIVAPSAALLDGEARGWRVDGGLRPGDDRQGRVVILFDPRPRLVAWRTSVEGKPDPALLAKVRQLR